MAIRNPTFNLKTGADSDLIVAREITQTTDPAVGKIKRKDGLFTFPYLTRRTGDTLTGTTENIESNELKHGRTKSAPRKGTSSSSGDINFEFSAETFDDMMEAAFRGNWERWRSDTDSLSNKTGDTYQAGFFATTLSNGQRSSKKLIGTESTALIQMQNASDFVVHELNSLTNDVKYSLLRKYGGQTGEDLWQEFTHMAVNTMQLSVEINSIITGSFGFMGTNNPKIRNSDEVIFDFEDRMESVYDSRDKGEFNAATAYATNDVVSHEYKWYRAKAAIAAGAWDVTKWTEFPSREEALAVVYINKGEFSDTSTYDVNDAVLYNDKWYGCIAAIGTAGAWSSSDWKEFDAEEYFESIPDHATNTMQFTAREGFLFINGKRIEFAQSLSFSLDNGLQQKFAIFVPNAISTTPLALDITGDLSTYLVGGDSDAKKLFNDAIDNETVELLFCLQDKLEDPTALYVFQIFNAKHTENTINGNGEDTFDESLPWASFGEQACRVFKILLPRFTEAQEVDTTGGTGGYPDAVLLTPNTMLEGVDDIPVYDSSTKPQGIRVTLKVDGVEQTFTGVAGVDDGTGVDPAAANIYLDINPASDSYGQVYILHGITPTSAVQSVEFKAEWNGFEITRSFEIPSA